MTINEINSYINNLQSRIIDTEKQISYIDDLLINKKTNPEEKIKYEELRKLLMGRLNVDYIYRSDAFRFKMMFNTHIKFQRHSSNGTLFRSTGSIMIDNVSVNEMQTVNETVFDKIIKSYTTKSNSNSFVKETQFVKKTIPSTVIKGDIKKPEKKPFIPGDFHLSFTFKKTQDAIKNNENISFDEFCNIQRDNNELYALALQYLDIHKKISNCKYKDMRNSIYRELIINKTRILMKIHKFFPTKNSQEIINYLKNVIEHRESSSICRELPLPRTIEYAPRGISRKY